MTPPSAHRTRWANAKASVSASDPSSPNGSHATLVRKSKWARPSWPARILHVPHAFSLALNDRPKPEHNTHRTRDGAEINALPPPHPQPRPQTPIPRTRTAPKHRRVLRAAWQIRLTQRPTQFAQAEVFYLVALETPPFLAVQRSGTRPLTRSWNAHRRGRGEPGVRSAKHAAFSLGAPHARFMGRGGACHTRHYPKLVRARSRDGGRLHGGLTLARLRCAVDGRLDGGRALGVRCRGIGKKSF